MAIRSTGIAAAAVGLLLPIATWILLVLLMHLLMLRRHLLLLLMHLLWHRAAIFRRTILGDAHPPEVLDGRLTSSPHLGSVQRRSWSSPLAREAGRGKDKRKATQQSYLIFSVNGQVWCAVSLITCPYVLSIF
jgi:hypothetical protein